MASNSKANVSTIKDVPTPTSSNSNVLKPSALVLNIFIQIVLALIVIVILYIITLAVLNIDSLIMTSNQDVKPHETIKILDGYASVSNVNNKSYNTVTPYADSFKKIGKSMNTMGGAQFTYQFWVKVQDADDDLFKDLIVVLKGDKRKYNLGYYTKLNENTALGEPTYKLMESKLSEYAVVAPMIQFTKSYRDLKIRINTNKNPIVDIDINMNQSPGAGRQNLLSLLAINSWFLLTFVFIDSFSVPQAAEDGIRFIMYVNDVPYIEHNASTIPDFKNNTLKQNDGDLFLFPDNTKGGEFFKVGNMNYMNYAMTHKEVLKSFALGPPTYPAIPDNSADKQAAYISAFNRIDQYNY